MLILVSPAKSLDYETPPLVADNTQPLFLDDSQELIDQLKKLPPAKVGKLMNISDKLAQLNAQRFKEWKQPLTTDTAKQCLFAFQGDVYKGMDADLSLIHI